MRASCRSGARPERKRRSPQRIALEMSGSDPPTGSSPTTTRSVMSTHLPVVCENRSYGMPDDRIASRFTIGVERATAAT